MQNLVIQTGAGDVFDDVAKRAKEISKTLKEGQKVEFDFNGVKCLVSEKTVIDWLYRDYSNAHIMEWKEVGDDCKMQYDANTEIELYSRKLKRAKQRAKDEEAREKEENKERATVEKLTKDVHLLIWPEKSEEYKTYVETNSKDGYSRGVVDYAEAWAKLMQIEISKGRTKISDIAEETQKPLGYMGITGFMYGCVMQALAHFWQFGEELREWHNNQYGHSGKGVVNPAILTFGGK